MSTISKNMYSRPVVFYNWAVALHAILVVNHELRAQAYTERYKFTFVELICDVLDECGQLHVGTSVRKLTRTIRKGKLISASRTRYYVHQRSRHPSSRDGKSFL